MFLRAHSAASKEDNPGWCKATQGKFANDYWKAMEVEIFMLEPIDAWDVVEQEDDMNVINSTWAFKFKLIRWIYNKIQSQILCLRRPAAGRN
jgi:hypothetical protein